MLDTVRKKKPKFLVPVLAQLPILFSPWFAPVSLRTVLADIVYRRFPTGPVELVGEPEKGHACDRNGEIKRVLKPTCHNDGVGREEIHGRSAKSPLMGTRTNMSVR